TRLKMCQLSNVYYDRIMQDENTGTDNSFLLYPDPAADLLQVYWEGKASTWNHVMIFDASGILKFETYVYDGLKQHPLEINVASFPNGLYQMVIDAGSEMKRG